MKIIRYIKVCKDLKIQPTYKDYKKYKFDSRQFISRKKLNWLFYN